MGFHFERPRLTMPKATPIPHDSPCVGSMESWNHESWWLRFDILISVPPFHTNLISVQNAKIHYMGSARDGYQGCLLILHQLQLAIDSGVSTWNGFSRHVAWSKLSSSPPCWSTVTASSKGVLINLSQKKNHSGTVPGNIPYQAHFVFGPKDRHWYSNGPDPLASQALCPPGASASVSPNPFMTAQGGPPRSAASVIFCVSCNCRVASKSMSNGQATKQPIELDYEMLWVKILHWSRSQRWIPAHIRPWNDRFVNSTCHSQLIQRLFVAG